MANYCRFSQIGLTEPMDPILSVIDEALLRAGLSDAAASKLAVGNYALIKNMRAARGDDKRYSFQSLNELARVLGLECYFGPKRELRGFSEGDEPQDLSNIEAIRGGYLPIPWLDASTRKGSSPFAVAQSWLASNALAPDHLRAVEATNVHLPFPFEGKPVAIVDTVAAQRGASHLWAYREGPTTNISRAAFDNDLAVLFPGGDDGPIRLIKRSAPGDVTLLGRVVWIGGKLE